MILIYLMLLDRITSSAKMLLPYLQNAEADTLSHRAKLCLVGTSPRVCLKGEQEV